MVGNKTHLEKWFGNKSIGAASISRPKCQCQRALVPPENGHFHTRLNRIILAFDVALVGVRCNDVWALRVLGVPLGVVLDDPISIQDGMKR